MATAKPDSMPTFRFRQYRAVLCLYVLLILSFIFLSWGCEVAGLARILRPETEPYKWQIVQGYRNTILGTSNSADVLSVIQMPEYELASQSQSVIAVAGEKKDGFMKWFKLVAFDENSLPARRKYIAITDERAKVLADDLRAGLVFDCELILGDDVLDEPFANDNARRIATLKAVLEKFQEDLSEVRRDSAVIDAVGAMAAEQIQAALVKLDAWPALAARLSEDKGIECGSITFRQGRIQMLTSGDTARLKVRMGTGSDSFADLPEAGQKDWPKVY